MSSRVDAALPAFTPRHRGGRGSPLVCIHGFTDTWRTWELVLPALERRHDVLAPTLAGHAGGPPVARGTSRSDLVDALEHELDRAGFERAHLVGNSLGGYLALQLAARGRAESVVALAPGGGTPVGDDTMRETLAYFLEAKAKALADAPRADELARTPEGRRAALERSVAQTDHIPADLIAHEIRSVAYCDGAEVLIESALRTGWSLESEQIVCPVRIVWGTSDLVLPWPYAATRYRDEWLPNAEWVLLDGVGHCPQLEVPDRVAELVLEFTAQSPSSARRRRT